MIINRLEIECFKRYGEVVTIEFPENCKTLAILGRNEVGKSSLFQSIEFALYGLKQGQGINKEDIITWGKERTRVEMQFMVANEKYQLRRELKRNGSSKVSLTRIIDGVIDSSNAITNLREVQIKIEQLLGLDKDTFGRLLYIRQKDLDALKDLYKSKREQSLNKIMGIDIFDDSTELVKSDLTELKRELEKKESKMNDVICPHKITYEQKQVKRQNVAAEMKTLNESLPYMETEIRRLENILAKQEWMYKYEQSTELERSTSGNLSQILDQQSQLDQKSQTLNIYNDVIDICTPEYNRLTKLSEEYQKIENKLKEETNKLTDLETKKSTLIKESGLSPKQTKLLDVDMVKYKNRHLRMFLLLLITGIIIIAASLFTTLYLAIAAIIAITFSVVSWKKYQQADNLFMKTTEINSITGQVEEKNSSIKQLNNQMQNLISTSNFDTSQDISIALNSIINEIAAKTGFNNIQALTGVRDTLDTEVANLRSQDILTKKNDLENQVKNIRDSIQSLENQKPVGIEPRGSYDENTFNKIKEECKDKIDVYNKTQTSLQKLAGQDEELRTDLDVLYDDYCFFPILETQISDDRIKISVLERISVEYTETAKEFREKVIPNARMYVNDILPTLTGGRYSDFDISPDLQFKVYSIEAGSYKNREVFSGGTQDQFLIALRLAFTQSILRSRIYADKFCIMMDECISSSDGNRKEGIFAVLKNQSVFSQIFIIAHEEIEALADHSMVLVNDQNGYTKVSSKSW